MLHIARIVTFLQRLCQGHIIYLVVWILFKAVICNTPLHTLEQTDLLTAYISLSLLQAPLKGNLIVLRFSSLPSSFPPSPLLPFLSFFLPFCNS